MFTDFFYLLRKRKVPVSITEWMTLMEALSRGLVTNLDAFYYLARAVLVKSETFFDQYDVAFQEFFTGIEFPSDISQKILEWLKDPINRKELTEEERALLDMMDFDELLKEFRVVLLEAGRLGSGATGAGLGLVSPGPGVPFSTRRDRFGLRDARWIWETARRSALDLAAFLRRAGVRCDLTPVEEVLLAVGEAQIARLEREHQIMKDAGLDVAWLPARRARASYGAEALAALKLGGASTIDPLRACLAVARRLHRAGGGLVFERSPVTRVRAARKSVTQTTTEGTVVASTVVLATGAPPAGYGALARHFREQQAYAVQDETFLEIKAWGAWNGGGSPTSTSPSPCAASDRRI